MSEVMGGGAVQGEEGVGVAGQEARLLQAAHLQVLQQVVLEAQ